MVGVWFASLYEVTGLYLKPRKAVGRALTPYGFSYASTHRSLTDTSLAVLHKYKSTIVLP